ncbi:type ISP restriction/modification enzyme [Chloroflexus sp.]|uniref:type ISP restriction/modification enzyme n=1 Tax=Chloroflexus sp. TaxID=1904827 RepID=UPI003A10007E
MVRNAYPRYLYRPFDVRSIFYHEAMIERPRAEVMRHILAGENVALVLPRRVEHTGSWQHVFLASTPIEHVAVSLKTIDYCFPPHLPQLRLEYTLPTPISATHTSLYTLCTQTPSLLKQSPRRLPALSLKSGCCDWHGR